MITDQIINTDFLNENLTKIIPSIIVLDQNLTIKTLSADIAKLLYYQTDDLINCDIQVIFHPSNQSFIESLNELKTKGYFDTRKIALQNKYNKKVYVEISGFYLGLLSDSNNSIILNIRDIDKLQTYQNLLNDKVSEFNELVYRTYHDLRGPVATIQGLLNISKYNSDSNDHKKTYELMEESTNILNARLTNISAIFDSNYLSGTNYEDANLHSMQIAAYRLIKTLFPEKKVQFRLSTDELKPDLISSDLLNSIFSNIIQSLNNSRIISDKPIIKMHLRSFQDLVQIKCIISGFNIDFNHYEKILNHEFNFSEIMNDENLLRVYILNSQVQKHNGNIYPSILDQGIWSLNIVIPYE